MVHLEHAIITWFLKFNIQVKLGIWESKHCLWWHLRLSWNICASLWDHYSFQPMMTMPRSRHWDLWNKILDYSLCLVLIPLIVSIAPTIHNKSMYLILTTCKWKSWKYAKMCNIIFIQKFNWRTWNKVSMHV